MTLVAAQAVQTALDAKRRNPVIHVYTSHDSGEVYDITQTDDTIRDGDILVVELESIVAILVQAWPTAITQEQGNFHGPRNEPMRSYPYSMLLAIDEAQKRGYTLHQRVSP